MARQVPRNIPDPSNIGQLATPIGVADKLAEPQHHLKGILSTFNFPPYEKRLDERKHRRPRWFGSSRIGPVCTLSETESKGATDA